MKYTNPVLPADFSDPDVIRVGSDFYMVSSSFNFNPCIPVLHSVNLVDWELVGYVMDSLPLEEYKEVVHGGGVWAPSLRVHNGVFYCMFPLYGHGIWVCETRDIRGKWSAPRRLLKGEGLEDPCPIWTGGRCFVAHAFAKSKAGFNSVIAVQEVTPDLTAPIGDYKIVYDGHNDNPCIEGPKFYERGGYFYIYAPAGGVKHGWQTALRSRGVFGPYESKIVLMSGDSGINGPHQGALIDLPDGGWAFMHFSDKGAYGRVVYLQPAEWVNGWCLCGEVKDKNIAGTPVNGGEYPLTIASEAAINYSDSFEEKLSPVWQTPAVCGDGWYSVRGGLKIKAAKHEGGAYNMARCLTQRFPCFNFTVSVRARAEGDCYAALAVTGLTCCSLCLFKDRVEVRVSDNGGERIIHTAKITPDGKEIGADGAVLGVTVQPYCGAEETNKVMCFFTVNGLVCADVLRGSTFLAAPGRWVGARVALYAACDGEEGGHAVFKDYKVT